jgi:negative regulator of sigma E activity
LARKEFCNGYPEKSADFINGYICCLFSNVYLDDNCSPEIVKQTPKVLKGDADCASYNYGRIPVGAARYASRLVSPIRVQTP